MDEIAELRDALDRLHAAMDDLAVRGLRAAAPQDLAKLAALRDEFRAAGAGHIAERLNTTIEAVRADDRGAAATLLRAMTATRLFDRMLTLEVAARMLSAPSEADDSAVDASAVDDCAAADSDPDDDEKDA